MADEGISVGIIGGTGMLGSAIARAIAERDVLQAYGGLWVSNRSGSAGPLADLPGLVVTTDNRRLVAACDVVFLSVAPADAAKLDIDAEGRLVISVMAGIRLAELARIADTPRVIRAMSSPAAAQGLAYSPYFAGPGATAEDRALAQRFLAACGLTDEAGSEDEIDLFTAITGPVPGFAALFADCLIRHAVARGVDPGRAERAVRQLFRASGVMLADGPAPAEHVRQMIDYAGTTAAGMTRMLEAGLAEAIGEGIDASAAAARALGD